MRDSPHGNQQSLPTAEATAREPAASTAVCPKHHSNSAIRWARDRRIGHSAAKQGAETARAGWAYAEQHLTVRLDAYSRLLAFLARTDDWESRTPVVRVEERNEVLRVFAQVMLLGTPDVRVFAERLLGGFFGTSEQVGPVRRGWAPPEVRGERLSISRDELDAGMPLLLEATRADVAEAEARWQTAAGDLTGVST